MVISGEPFGLIADELIKLSCARGGKYKEPTPLVSDFWSSTFTPSSTEVYARGIAENKNDVILTTIQPCIRFVDFGHAGDAVYSLFFNMWSCFFNNAETNLEENIETIFNALEEVIGVQRTSWFATYHPIDSNNRNKNIEFLRKFDNNLLIKSGLKPANCYPVNGTATYLHQTQSKDSDNPSNHLAGTPAEQVDGPRIEIFAGLPNDEFLEFATLVLFDGNINLPGVGAIKVPPSLAVAAGIERLALLRFKKNTICDFGIFRTVLSLLTERLSQDALYAIFKKELSTLTSLIIADTAIKILSPDMPNRSNFGPNKERRRIKKEIIRLSSELGISSEVIDNIGNKCFTSMEGARKGELTRS